MRFGPKEDVADFPSDFIEFFTVYQLFVCHLKLKYILDSKIIYFFANV